MHEWFSILDLMMYIARLHMIMMWLMLFDNLFVNNGEYLVAQCLSILSLISISVIPVRVSGETFPFMRNENDDSHRGIIGYGFRT